MRTWYSRSVWAGFELLFRPWMHQRLDGIHIRGVQAARLPAGPGLARVAARVAALALESWRRHRTGTVVWKGRVLTHRELA